jgi:branched-chain amino acid transport system permease protein
MRRVKKTELFLGAIAGLTLMFLGSSPAQAADANETNIIVTVIEEKLTDGEIERLPVEGVTVTATGASGVVTGITGDDGVISLAVIRTGEYLVAIDVNSLPDGVTPQSNRPTELTINFDTGATIGSGERKVSLFVGDDRAAGSGRWEQLPQTLVNGIKLSLIIAMCAVGLSLIYGTTGLTNFAHGEIVTIGALIAFWFNKYGFGLHLLLAAPFGIAASALAAGAFERQVWRPLRRRGTSLTSMMIISIGVAISVRYIYLFFFGGRNRRYSEFVGTPEIDFGIFGITPRDLGIVIISAITAIGLAVFLSKAKLGKAIRAVSDNPDLASATGINTDRIILTVWLIGGALAGMGGLMLGASSGVQWDMGNIILLLMFAAITVGGLGNPYGALLGSFVVGMFTELWTWVFPNVVELKTLGALLALVLVLLVRPQGLLGRKERIG